jgi:CheY-like chemotaxis protein
MARILVVDDDPWTQRMVSAVLSHAGHHVDLASDGWEALIRVGRARPDLVITELHLPTTDGWALAEAVRAQPENADLPFVFLDSTGSLRETGPGFRTGHDVLVGKPFRLEMLEGAVGGLLDRRPDPTDRIEATETRVDASTFRAPAPPAPGSPGIPHPHALTGALEQFGLSSVLIVCELERKSGVLMLSGEQSTGRVFLREGRVVRAHVDGAARGAIAVYDMLAWTRGRFEFSSDDVGGDDEIGSSTSFLLLEAARLQDESKLRTG